MKLIETLTTDSPTTIQKVSYKGDIWGRRENSKLIHWFVYDSESNKRFVYQCCLYNNSWGEYTNNCTPIKPIDVPYVEKSYQKLINPLKLYKFELECFYTTLYGVFIASEKEVQSNMGKTVCYGNVDDKDSNITELFSWWMLEELKVDNITIEDLLKANGGPNYTISGYNPLHYLSITEE